MTDEHNSSVNISGWYYDLQMEINDAKSEKDSENLDESPGKGRMTCVTLHANRVRDDKGEWVEIPEADWDPDDAIPMRPVGQNSGGNAGENKGKSEGTSTQNSSGESINPNSGSEPAPDKCRYDRHPIAKSILNEDFSVSVANSWSDFGGDMMGEMWNSLKTLAPYADYIQGAITQMDDDWNNTVSAAGSGNEEAKKSVENVNNSTTATFLKNIVHWAAEGIQNRTVDVADYLNRSLVMQGTRFSYYSGSGTSFSNLGMKFTLFPTWNENGDFITVNDQVSKIYPYVMGHYKSTKEDIKGIMKAVNRAKNDGKDTPLTEEQRSTLDSMDPNLVQWMCPPGGFRANIHFIDFIQPGTLKLKFGAYFSIPNLVCENATFTYSKQMVKNPASYLQKHNGSEFEDIISPLFCDVTLQFRPCTKYSDRTLKDFIMGAGNLHTLARVNNDLRKKLEGELHRLNTNLSIVAPVFLSDQDMQDRMDNLTKNINLNV